MDEIAELGRVAFAIKDERDALRAENTMLRELLTHEAALRVSIAAPWKCTDSKCPYFDKPMQKGCGCHDYARKQHSGRVAAAIGGKW